MQSMKQPDNAIVTMVAPNGGVTKDVPVKIGSQVVIPIASASAGDDFAGYTRGVFKLPKVDSTELAAGVWVKWDVSAGECVLNQTASGDFDLGVVRKTAASSDTEVEVIVGGPARRKAIVEVDFTDVSAAGDSSINFAPFAGRITRTGTQLGGAITGADCVVAPKIGNTAITGGALTIAYSGSAAGDVDNAYPTAANVVAAGDLLKMTSGGESSTTATCKGFFEIEEL